MVLRFSSVIASKCFVVSRCSESCCSLVPAEMATIGSVVPPSRTTFRVGPAAVSVVGGWRRLCFLLLTGGVQFEEVTGAEGAAVGQGFGGAAVGDAGAPVAGGAFACDVCCAGAACAIALLDAAGDAPGASNHPIMKTIVTELICRSIAN